MLKMLRDDSGQGLVEYAIVIALVAFVAVAALLGLGHAASNKLSAAAKALP